MKVDGTRPTLGGDRLMLVPLHGEDARDVYADVIDPLLYRYIAQEPPVTVDDTVTLFRRWAAGSVDPNTIWLNWIGTLAHETQHVGLYQATIFPAEAVALIGYIVFRRFQHRGYARDGVRTMIDYLATRPDVATIRAEIGEANAASRKVAEALDFRLTGRNAGEGRDGDSICDDLVYELGVAQRRD